MINFRYHIVSLMAVFLALSVGIAVGVTLRPSVDTGLAQQAAQDREQVQDLRTELDRRAALEDYHDSWDSQAGTVVTDGALAGDRVALVTMPEAPGATVDAIEAAVTAAGGTVTRTATVSERAFDPARAGEVTEALRPYAGSLSLPDAPSPATQVGAALSRALLAPTTKDRDPTAVELTRTLTRDGLIRIDGDSPAQAQLAILITREAPEIRPAPETLAAHLDLALALKVSALGVVVAGPNSTEIEGTDVLAVRTDAAAVDELSTVDVADLSSGVVTVVLAGREQLRGRSGHYGALTDADGPLPELPVR